MCGSRCPSSSCRIALRCSASATKLNNDGVNFIHSGTGKMSWGSKGVFAFQWCDEAGKATQIIHQPTGCTATPPAHVTITKLFQIQSNWNDHTAVCFLGPAKMVMKDFFAKHQGPHLVTQLAPKEVKQFIEAIYEKYLGDTKKLKSTVDEKDFVTMAPPSKKAKTAAAAERARAALTRRRQTQEDRRTDVLETLTTT